MTSPTSSRLELHLIKKKPYSILMDDAEGLPYTSARLKKVENKMVKLYGIANCDTMKKARQWLKDQGIPYEFHDYKKVGVDENQLRSWVDTLGWETLLNRRGMMWRKLDDSVKAAIDEASAIRVMLQTPSIIKRPLLDDGKSLHVGFKVDQYAKIFS